MLATDKGQGRCPKCGSSDIEFQGVPEGGPFEAIADYERDELEYIFQCENCNQRFREVYRLVYIESVQIE